LPGGGQDLRETLMAQTADQGRPDETSMAGHEHASVELHRGLGLSPGTVDEADLSPSRLVLL
jgi:hypothetical protein